MDVVGQGVAAATPSKLKECDGMQKQPGEHCDSDCFLRTYEHISDKQSRKTVTTNVGMA